MAQPFLHAGQHRDIVTGLDVDHPIRTESRLLEILTTEDEIEMWMTAEWSAAQALQRPLADEVLIELPEEAPDEPQGRLL